MALRLIRPQGVRISHISSSVLRTHRPLGPCVRAFTLRRARRTNSSAQPVRLSAARPKGIFQTALRAQDSVFWKHGCRWHHLSASTNLVFFLPVLRERRGDLSNFFFYVTVSAPVLISISAARFVSLLAVAVAGAGGRGGGETGRA